MTAAPEPPPDRVAALTGPSAPTDDAEPIAPPAPGLPGDTQRTKLPDRVVTYWRVGALLGWVPVIVIVGAALFGAGQTAIGAGVTGLLVLATAVDLAVVQPRRHALWWYAIGDEQIDLQHGWLVVRRTAIPMTRVQHVQLQRGPLANRFRLAELEIFTAAGSVKIPALDRDEGDRIRQRIADLARIADDL